MTAETDRTDDRVETSEDTEKHSTTLLIAGIILCLAGMMCLCVLVAKIWFDPMTLLGNLLLAVVFAVLFQVGFILCACDLADRGKRAVAVGLPTVLVCLSAVGLLTGFIGYLVISGPDMTYLQPEKPEYGWDRDNVSKGLSTCSVKYSRTSNMGQRSMRSTVTITCSRRKTPPMMIEMIRRMIAGEPKPEEGGPVRRTSRDAEEIKIGGQPAYKVVDNMSGMRGTNFTHARYFWYSPKLNRQLQCMAVIDGGGAWQLDGVEKMLNSIPAE